MTTSNTTRQAVQLIKEADSPYENLVPGREVTSHIDNIEETEMGGGFFRQTSGDAVYTCNVLGDEILLVREGRLEVVQEDGTSVEAHAGEAIFIAKGTRATFKGDEGTRTFWVISQAIYE